MKKWLFIPLIFALLVLYGCKFTPAAPAPTPTVTAQPSPTPTALTTITPQTSSPTATLMPNLTNTPVPLTPTPLPTITPTPLPTPPGQIFFMLSPDPAYGNEPWALYRAVPDGSPDTWLVTPIMENVVPGGGGIQLSPDQSKFVVSLVHDIDGDGELYYVSGLRPEPVTDFSDLFIYDLVQDAMWILPDTRRHTVPVWMPDSQAIISISNDHEIVNTFLDGTPREIIVPQSMNPGGSLTISPDGTLLLYTTGGSPYYLWAYDRETDEFTLLRSGTNINFGASPWNVSGDWWAYGDLAGNTFVLNRNTLTLIELVPEEISGGMTWSPDGQILTHIVNRSALYFLEPYTLSSFEVLIADLLHFFTWSPHENVLAIQLTENDHQRIILYDADTDNTRVLLESEPEQSYRLRSWSPDGQWLLLVIEDATGSGIYVLHVDSGALYQVMDIADGVSNYFLWAPISPDHN